MAMETAFVEASHYYWKVMNYNILTGGSPLTAYTRTELSYCSSDMRELIALFFFSCRRFPLKLQRTLHLYVYLL
jgi:hypothetical protein